MLRHRARATAFWPAQQPQTAFAIDYGHQLAPDEGFWLPGISPNNLMAGTAGTFTGAPTVIGDPVYGNSMVFSGTSQKINTNLMNNGASRFTLMCICQSPSIPGSADFAAPFWRDVHGIHWNHTSSASFRGACSVRTTIGFFSASFASLSANTWYVLASTWDGSNLRAYNGGTLQNTTATTGTIAYTNSSNTTQPMQIAAGQYTTDFFNGTIAYCYKRNTALDAPAILELSRNPWCFLRPVSSRRVTPATAAAAGTWRAFGSLFPA